MLTSSYFFGKKGYETWGIYLLFNIMDDPTDVLQAIGAFANINKDDAVSALDVFVNEENENWDLFLINISIVFNISGNI